MKKEENLEKQVKELEKSNRWMKGILLAFVGIFFVFLCVGFGYVLGKDNSKSDGVKDVEETKKEKNDETEEVEVENLTVNSPVVKDLFEKFREDQNCTYAGLADDLETSIEAKRYAAFLQLEESKFNEKTCGSLSDGSFKYDVFTFVCGENDQSSQYAYKNDWAGFHKAIANEKVTVFSAIELKNKVQEMFGQNVNYSDNSFSISDGLLAYYDKNNNLYAQFYCFNCGGECAMYSVHTLKSVEQDGTTLKLYTVLTDEDEMSSSSSDIIYTFELEKETGNYIFVSRVEK